MPKQLLLVKNSSTPIIFYDDREEKSNVIQELKKLNVILIKKRLDVADYLIGENIGVERKTYKDFLRSIYEGRLFDQIQRLREVFPNPILIIEKYYKITNEKDKKIEISTISRLFVDYNCLVFFSRGEKDTAYFLYRLAYYNQIKLGKLPVIGIKKKSLSDKEVAINMLTCLPGIGRKRAEEILKRFKSIKNFVNAPITKILGVRGLDAKTAKRIKRILEGQSE